MDDRELALEDLELFVELVVVLLELLLLDQLLEGQFPGLHCFVDQLLLLLLMFEYQ